MTLRHSSIAPTVSLCFLRVNPKHCIADPVLETPYAEPARQLLQLLKTKASDEQLQSCLDSIHDTASSLGVVDPLVPVTDAYVTAICYLGSKSLSHVLSQIERCRERLLRIGSQSEVSRRQIISSVMEYWNEKPGVGVNVVDKLLNYTILTPASVIQWALGDHLGKGQILTQAHVYEVIASTITKVTGRIHQIVVARNSPKLSADERAVFDITLNGERENLEKLFNLIEDALVGIAEGSNDVMAEGADQDTEEEARLREWGQRWLRVIRRKRGVEEAWIMEMLQPTENMMEDVIGDGANGSASDGSFVRNGAPLGADNDPADEIL